MSALAASRSSFDQEINQGNSETWKEEGVLSGWYGLSMLISCSDNLNCNILCITLSTEHEHICLAHRQGALIHSFTRERERVREITML